MTSPPTEEFVLAAERRLATLRRRYGAQPWLTVVSGVVATGYRLAELSGPELLELVTSDARTQGNVRVEQRRKPFMRLRRGFDDGLGTLHDRFGLILANLRFGAHSYSENPACHSTSIKLSTKLASSSLLITGGLNRRLAAVVPDLPRCLRGGSTRAGPIESSSGGKVTFDVIPHWETLGLMPDGVADELGVARQTRLDSIPWIDAWHPRREDGTVRLDGVRPTASCPSGVRPALRLVSSLDG